MNEANTMADILGRDEAMDARFPVDPQAPATEKPIATDADRKREFTEKLRQAINSCSRENASDTPDFVLAEYLVASLDAYATAVKARDRWFGADPWGRSYTAVLAPAQDER